MTNTGIEKPATEKPDSTRSSQPPMRQAAMVPSGTATSTASTSVPTARLSVGSSRWAISSVTGLFR